MLLPGLIGLALLQSTPASTEATLAGRVLNESSGEPIASAVVTLPDLDRAGASGSDGRYAFHGLVAGPTHVSVRAIGFAPRIVHALVPTHGTLTLDLLLTPHHVTLPPIEVVPDVVLRGGDPRIAYPDRSLASNAIRDHPLTAEPDVLVALGGGEVGVRAEAPDGLHVRGSPADQVAFLIDGVPVLGTWHSAGVHGALNPDVIGRVSLEGSAPSPALPHALAGTITATTRVPEAPRASGAFSVTHLRAAADGEIGNGVAFLAAGRRTLPGFLAPDAEPSYVRGTGGDLLGKLSAPLLGGRAMVLGYHASDDLDAAASVDPDLGPIRNEFAWQSTSAGVGWSRPPTAGLPAISGLGWLARSESRATWLDPLDRLDADRQDVGGQFSLEWFAAGSRTRTGARLERIETTYEPLPATDRIPRDASLTIGTAFIEHERVISHTIAVRAGASLAFGAGSRLDPRVLLRWNPRPTLVVSAAVSRSHQYAQSLRNTESVVGLIYPAELWLVAGGRFPVARADQLVTSVAHQPTAGVQVGLQVWVRRMHDLLLVAPVEQRPFALDAESGDGQAAGMAAAVDWRSRKLGVTAAWSLEDVEFEAGSTEYVPWHGTTQTVTGGVIANPSATWAIRLGVALGLGRRATAVAGPFEWESCNLLDRGCEFAGTPTRGNESLGGTSPPAYARVDLGVRKHWHLDIADRNASVAVYGTVTNLLGRGNVLTYTRDPESGGLDPIVMRPVGPLVLGMEWEF